MTAERPRIMRDDDNGSVSDYLVVGGYSQHLPNVVTPLIPL